MDRMEQIKANMAASRRNLRPPYIGDDDADWLVSEVERLRRVVEGAAAVAQALDQPTLRDNLLGAIGDLKSRL
jgi:hypothetical protein